MEVMTVGQPTDTDRVATLLQEAAETHHRVFRITDGADEDWASWYADWLLDLSELSDLLGARPVRSHLVHALVQLDRDHAAAGTDDPWPAFYARRLSEQFGPAQRRATYELPAGQGRLPHRFPDTPAAAAEAFRPARYGVNIAIGHQPIAGAVVRMIVTRHGHVEEEYDGLTIGGATDASTVVNAHSRLIRIIP